MTFCEGTFNVDTWTLGWQPSHQSYFRCWIMCIWWHHSATGDVGCREVDEDVREDELDVGGLDLDRSELGLLTAWRSARS